MSSRLSDNSSPMKPPRGVKSSKETGILMTVIKTLSTSASTDVRDREKAKLEKEYRRSDHNLEELISHNHEALSKVMQTFTQTCIKITDAKTKLAKSKANLQKCKNLLHCKREDLERLWLEGIEHKNALEIFNKIDDLRRVPEIYTKALSRKQYMVAAEALIKSLDGWDENLDQIEGLKELYADLKTKKQKLYEILKEELFTELFQTATQDSESKSLVPFTRSASNRRSSGRNQARTSHMKARKIILDFSNPLISQNAPNSQEIEAKMSSIVQCLNHLRELPKLAQDLKSEMNDRFLLVINQTSQQIIEFGDANALSNDTMLLTELLKLAFEHFRWIIRNHNILTLLLQKSVGSNHSIILKEIQSEADVWFEAQVVIQSILKLYFDISGSGETKRERTMIMSTIPGEDPDHVQIQNINSFFIKKRPTQRQIKRPPLFKFQYSLHGLNVNDYTGNEKQTILDRTFGDKNGFLVCKPNTRNIITVYSVLQSFIMEIEQSLGYKCELRKFVGNTINRFFVQQLYKEISEAVEAAKKGGTEAWRDVTSVEEAKQFGSPRPLLVTVVNISRSMGEVLALARDLPSHAEQLLRILEALLNSYLEAVRAGYISIVHPEENTKIISAAWVQDEDIERLLKSLPNWVKLKRKKESNQNQRTPDEDVNSMRKESDLLCGIFGGKTISQSEIISDFRLLEQLAHLHESLEWFSERIAAIASSFKRLLSDDNASSPPMDLQELIDKLNSISMRFQEFADICLIVLNLELRVHCFFYLLPLCKKSELAPNTDTQVPDQDVVQLTRDLVDIENALSPSLVSHKLSYVFEGVGQLISAIFISGAQDIRRINENGIKRICRDIFAIQQALCEITKKPEIALDHARQYFELFNKSLEEIVEEVMEKGPNFKELEYINALHLLFRSKPGGNHEVLNEHLQRLSNILGDIGVTV